MGGEKLKFDFEKFVRSQIDIIVSQEDEWIRSVLLEMGLTPEEFAESYWVERTGPDTTASRYSSNEVTLSYNYRIRRRRDVN